MLLVSFKLLLVDDEESLVKGLCHSLKNEGFLVEPAFTGNEAMELIEKKDFDLVLLDLMLPGVDGLEVCRRIRKRSRVPIIMLTAKGDDVDRIVGLELGADDYLPKPFNTRELIARIHAVLRRTRSEYQEQEDQVIEREDLIIDLNERSATRGQRKLDFTRTEFNLLALLASNPGRVFSREELLNKVWGADYYDLRTVDVCLGRLRKKIEDDHGSPSYLLTKWGVGYYFTK